MKSSVQEFADKLFDFSRDYQQDLTIQNAEPNALIGFAGPRVIKQTIGQDLPEGFQTSEFLLEKGFLDLIVERKDLKEKLSQILRIIKT